MIVSFGDEATEHLWTDTKSAKLRGLPADIRKVAMRKLMQIAASTDLDDLRVPPGNHLEALAGSLAGYHSIRINKQWRVVFRWAGSDAHDVRIVDYH